jgi:nucleoside-diphosphate-sugar epimerase
VAAAAPVLEPAPPEVDDPESPGNYGPCKVACERAVLDGYGVARAFICRAGLIIGPGDRSNRFGYWVSRLVRGGEVLAPGAPDDLVQYIDVHDLAGWLVHAASTGLAGTYDGIGAPVTREHFLTHVAAGVATPAELTWVDQEFLLAEGVRPGPVSGRSRCGCRSPSTAGSSAAMCPRRSKSAYVPGTSPRLRARPLSWWLAGEAVHAGSPGLPGGDEAGLSLGDEAELLQKRRGRTS